MDIKKIKLMIERAKMVPTSAKAGKDIDSQWLEPGSYDKRLLNATMGHENIYDVDSPEHQADNFRAQDLVKKNRKLPLKEQGEAAPSTSTNRVGEVYEIESLDLLDEIMDIIEELDEDDYVYWKSVAASLKDARDNLLASLPLKEDLNESFKVGSISLSDGSTIKISRNDAKALNAALAGTSNKDKLMVDATKSSKDFKEFLEFAHNLNEDFAGAVDSLLEDLTIEQLEYVIENDLDEGEIWNAVKAGTKAGSKVGSKVGQAAGTVAGGMYGGAVGGGTAIARKIARSVRKKRLRTESDERGTR